MYIPYIYPIYTLYIPYIYPIYPLYIPPIKLPINRPAAVVLFMRILKPTAFLTFPKYLNPERTSLCNIC